MSLSPPPLVLIYTLFAFALFGLAIILVWWTARHNLVATTCLTQLAVITFITWKQGFVRAHGALVFLYFLPLAFGLLFHRLVSQTLSKGIRYLLWVTYAALITCVLLAVDAVSPGASIITAKALPQRLGDRARLLLRAVTSDLGTEHLTLKRDPRARAGDLLPTISERVGDQTVDVFHQRPAIAIINGLNYRPRPVIQSYSAYTPMLQHLNLDFYRSPARPHYVLLDWETIDNRLPTLDDAPTMIYVLNNYKPVLWDGKFLLLEHLSSSAASPQYRLVHTTTLAFGQRLDVSGWSRAPLFMRTRIDPSLTGRVKALLYQPSPIMVDADYDDSGRRSFRFIPSLCDAKCLVSPLLERNNDVVDLWTGKDWKRLRGISFRVPESRFTEYTEPITVELYESPTFLGRIRVDSTQQEQLRAGQYPMFPLAPLRVQSPHPPRAVGFGGSIGLLVHAPGAVVLPVPPEARGLTGVFGLLEGAYRDGGQTDGVEFSIEVKDVNGEIRRGFVRMVRPRESPEDRGRLSFAIALRGGRDREIVLRTDPGPSDAWDWSVWSDLKFE